MKTLPLSTSQRKDTLSAKKEKKEEEREKESKCSADYSLQDKTFV